MKNGRKMDLTVFENLKQRKKKGNRALPTQHTRKGRMLFALFAMFTLCGVCFANPAFAADDPLTIVNNLSDFVFSLIRAVGVILLGWGVVQVGLSFQSHDPSQRSQGFLTLAGGLVVTFSKEILALIGVS